MPDRYIERKGIIFEEPAEKGDVDQTSKLQKENRNLTEKMEMLEREYTKVRKMVEFMMPLIESMNDKELKRKLLESRKIQTPTSDDSKAPKLKIFIDNGIKAVTHQERHGVQTEHPEH